MPRQAGSRSANKRRGEMLGLVKLFGVLVVAIGMVFAVRPTAVGRYVSLWREGRRLYLIVILRLVIGTIFLVAASSARSSGNLTIIGIIAIAGSLLAMLVGRERIVLILNTFSRGSIAYLRMMAVVAAYFGALVICSA